VTETEIFAFADVVKGLQRVFPKRWDEHEQAQLQRDYFKALRKFPLSQVAAGAEAWMQRGKFFPKPAEWIEAIPKRQSAPDLPVMSDEQTREYHRAEALRYEDKPCGCLSCREAEVTEKPLRFVPEVNPDGTDRRVRDGVRDRIVVAGHWAHGFELARWYAAKGEFYEQFYALCAKKGAR